MAILWLSILLSRKKMQGKYLPSTKFLDRTSHKVYYFHDAFLSIILINRCLLSRANIHWHSTGNKVCPWWIQCLHLRVWTNWFRENIYNGIISSSFFSACPYIVRDVLSTFSLSSLAEWARSDDWDNLGRELQSSTWSFPAFKCKNTCDGLWNWSTNDWNIQWTSQRSTSQWWFFQKISFHIVQKWRVLLNCLTYSLRLFFCFFLTSFSR